jgi:hypothetical protein
MNFYRGNFPVRPARTNKATVTAYARPLIASALLASGLVQLAAPVFAQSVTVAAANSEISNTATASYEDPNTPGTSISTVSNTVTVKVSKVAGISIKASSNGFTNEVTPNSFKPGETIYANFDVTNTGNDGLKFNVPKLATVSDPTKASFSQVEYYNGTNWLAVTATNGIQSQTIAAGGILKVRVKFVIDINATNTDTIYVTLGKTAAGNEINTPRETPNDNSYDIYTIDQSAATATATDAQVLVDGAAANGIREASAQQSLPVNADKQAYANITFGHETPVPVDATTDTVKYNVTVSVPTTAPAGSGKVADHLAPTTIKLDTTTTTAPTTASPGTGVDTPRVIISNPIPTGTTLTAYPTAPTDWKVVYAVTTDVVGTAIWTTAKPALGDVKQVGFIYDPATVPAATGLSLPKSNTAYSGFSITVTTGSLGLVTATAAVTGSTSANPLLAGTTAVTDSKTNTVTTARTSTGTIFNGPKLKPEAKGPGGSQETDFTEKSIAVNAKDAVRDGNGKLQQLTTETTLAQRTVVFDNTVKNSSNLFAVDTYLLPTVPATPGDLPPDTYVMIKNGAETRTYKYDGAVFTYSSSSGTDTTPIKLTVAAIDVMSYQVVVALPTGIDQLKGYPVPVTAFTTPAVNITAGMAALPGAVTAQNTTIDRVYTGYIDLIKEVRVLNTAADRSVSDVTIPYLNNRDNATAIANTKATPGKFIQYRIRAVNGATDMTGDALAADNVSLEASKINMVEDGVFVNSAGSNPLLPGSTGLTPNSNNWATTTSHLSGSAETLLNGATAGSINFTNGTGSTSNSGSVTKYVADFGTSKLAPSKTASFSFVRKVNQPDPQ